MSKHRFCARRTNDIRKDLRGDQLMHLYHRMNTMVFLRSEGEQGDANIEDMCADSVSWTAENQVLLWSGVAVASCLVAALYFFAAELKFGRRSMVLALCIISLLSLDGWLVE